jgi:predicted N-acetyltransferase YhbS
LSAATALDERAMICGVGPITVRTGVQNNGIGGLLMQTVKDRVRVVPLECG